MVRLMIKGCLSGVIGKKNKKFGLGLQYNNLTTLNYNPTCVYECVGKAEVVHSVEREEMVEELFTLVLTSQERVTLVQAPVT